MRARYGMTQVQRLASWNSSRFKPFHGSIGRVTCTDGPWQSLQPGTRRTSTVVPKVAAVRLFSTLSGNEDGTAISTDRGNGDAIQELPAHWSDEEIHNTCTKATNPRLFIKPSWPLEDRVKKVLNRPLGTMHPLDIVLTAKDLMRECAKRKSLEGMKDAHDIFDRLLEEKHYFNQLRTSASSDDKPEPYTIVVPEQIFEVLMFGWANLCRNVPNATTRMREVLDLMVREAEYDETLRMEREKEGIVVPDSKRTHGRKLSELEAGEMFAAMSCQPSVGIYNSLLHGLSQAAYRSIASAKEAEDTLRNMERLANRRGWHTKPNTKSFMYVLNAFARTNHTTAGDRAENVLRKMIQYHQQQIGLYREEIGQDYDLVNLENNVRRVVAPDTIAYTAVIQAYSQSDAKGSAEKALRLLTEVLQSNDPYLVPDAYIFSATINTFAKQAAKMKTTEARLQAATAAEDILRIMIDLLLIPGTQDKSPLINSTPFNVCMNAWANANLKESPTHANEILKMMLDPEFSAKTGIKATTASFNTCMHAWSRAASFDPQAPQRAEDLFQLMEQVDYVQPDITSYTTIISAYAKSKRPDKVSQARRVLEALLTNLPSLGKISVIPFTAVLNAALSSSIEQKSTHRSSSNSDPFGVHDDAAANSDLDAYSIATKIYDEVCSDVYDLGVAPDHLFFATMIDVIAKFTSHDSTERRQRLEQVFQEAKSSGDVSVKVVESLSRACPSQEMFLSMIGQQRQPIETINFLPRAWTRNVPPGFRRFKFLPSAKRRQDAQSNGSADVS